MKNINIKFDKNQLKACLDFENLNLKDKWSKRGEGNRFYKLQVICILLLENNVDKWQLYDIFIFRLFFFDTLIQCKLWKIQH